MADIALDVQSAPTTPAAGIAVVYVDTVTKQLASKDDAGAVTAYGAASGITTLTGDVTAGPGSGSQAATIAADAVTYAKMQNISATARVLGRKTAGSGDTEECALTDVLDFVGSAAQGNLLYRGASTWTQLAAGTAGFFLQTLGASANPAWALALDNRICDFRLSLTTAVPITTADVTAAGTVYACLMQGNRIALYDGTNWNLRTSAEFSLALSALTSGKPYDVFAYDNSGTPTLEFLVWTNDSTRATAIVLQDGVPCKSGATTRRLLGTFYTTGVATTEDSVLLRYLGNVNFPQIRSFLVTFTGTWTYGTNTIRQVNADTSKQVSFVIPLVGVRVFAETQVTAGNPSPSVGISTGVGLDSTSTYSGQSGGAQTQEANAPMQITSKYRAYPAVGRHFLSWNEAVDASGTSSMYGTGTVNNNNSCLTGELLA